jgi:hypothetical protein
MRVQNNPECDVVHHWRGFVRPVITLTIAFAHRLHIEKENKRQMQGQRNKASGRYKARVSGGNPMLENVVQEDDTDHGN